jgi:aryl-alcohol dehydrogenase-like predicted oxidoreductase
MRDFCCTEARAGEHDFRSINPRFQGENLEHNLALVEKLRSLAAEKDASDVQIAIAWAMAQGEDIVPLVGARKRDRLAEALGALRVNLSKSDLDAIEAIVPAGGAAGDRYHAYLMSELDSEKPAA